MLSRNCIFEIVECSFLAHTKHSINVRALYIIQNGTNGSRFSVRIHLNIFFFYNRPVFLALFNLNKCEIGVSLELIDLKNAFEAVN